MLSADSMAEEKRPRKKVAVIGSGLAGLTVAYLLHNDAQQRYEIIVFESGRHLSLDSASVDIGVDSRTGERSRVDVPMRAFTGGYYRNLMAMYDHLGIQYHWQKFRFEFWKYEDRSSRPGPYFIHASDNHECPPPRPKRKGLIAHAVEVVLVTMCFFWFMMCCHLVSPRVDETFDRYLQRIWMPRAFISRCLLPLVSAIATCSHQEVLAFPANDLVQYRRLIRGQKQYVVAGGVHEVQEALTTATNVRFGAQVIRIQPDSSKAELTFERFHETGQRIRESEVFDQVITAVPPNIVAEMFKPARAQLRRIPIRTLDTIVHRVPSRHRPEPSRHSADHVILKTADVAGGWTEATHLRPDGIAVTSCPMMPFAMEKEILARSTFTRTLRTPESRRIIGSILGGADSNVAMYESKSWKNGDQGVWVVGAWCFDGMVLLEGAVASAMHVAKAFGVEIPWER